MAEDNDLIGDIKIIRSRRRKKTIGARMINNIMCVYAPQSISNEHLNKVIVSFKKRFTRTMLKKRLNMERPLEEIADLINKKYFDGKLNVSSIEYVTDQTRKYGCCNYRDKSIRISHRIQEMPDWVRDYVVLHEMAHLVEPNHSKEFWEIVSCYKLSERAKGYLMAKGIAEEQQSDTKDGDFIKGGIQ